MTEDRSGGSTATAAAAAVAVAAGGAVYLYLKTSASRRKALHVVVFKDSGEGALGLHPIAAVVPLSPAGAAAGSWTRDALEAAAASALGIPGSAIDLYLQSSKAALTPQNLRSDVLNRTISKTATLTTAPVLIATEKRCPLSPAAAAGAPLESLPTGPPPLPYLGNALGMKNGPYAAPFYNAWVNFFGEGAYPHGRTVRLAFPRAMAIPGDVQKEHYGIVYDPSDLDGTVMVADCRVVEQMIARQESFPKRWTGAGQSRVRAIAASGLFTDSTDSPTWKTGHGVIPRSFNAVRVKNYFPILLEKTQMFVHAWASLGNGATVKEAHDWLTCMTADAVTMCAMDYDMDNIGRKSRNEGLHPLIVAFRTGLGWATKSLKPEDLFGTFNAKYNPFFDTEAAYDKVAEDAVKTCEFYIDKVVERTRAGEIGGPNSVITAMLNNKSQETGEYIKHKEFFGHMMTLMIAGHETTAAALANMFVQLAENPDVLAKCVKEIEEVMDGRIVPTYEDVSKLAYVEACFKETLRMFPSVASLSRDVGEDTFLSDKFLVRKGTRVIVNNVALHRDPEQWDQGVFGSPELYNPDRHMPGAPPRHPNAFMPFGYGVRGCIGQQLAMLEAKIFLCMVLNFFTFKLPEDFKLVVSNADGGASPHPQNFDLIISARPGGPLDKGLSLMAKCDWTKGATAVTAPGGDTASASDSSAKSATAGTRHGTKLQILFGSNSGTCEDFAQSLASTATDNGYTVDVGSLDSAVQKGLPGKGSALIIVTSTYNGLPPDNAVKFHKWLSQQKPGSLAGTQFAVFGCGNSNWEATFQKFPTEVHGGLVKAGATPMKDLATTDVSGSGFTEDFEEWMASTMVSMAVSFGLSGATAPSVVHKPVTYAARIKPEGHGGKPTLRSTAEARDWVKSQMSAKQQKTMETDGDFLLSCTVTSTQQLQSEMSDRATVLLELEMPKGSNVQYTAGDHLEVVVSNDAALVDAMLKALDLDGSTPAELDLGASVRNKKLLPVLKACATTLIPSDVRSILTEIPDLSKPPPRKVMAALADRCECPPEKKALLGLADPEGYKEKVLKTGITLAELLMKYRSVKISFEEVVTWLPRLSSRYYSISSSPLVSPNRVTITVGLVKYTTGTGRTHYGTSSGLIHSLKKGGSVLAQVKTLSGNFKLPVDDSQPVIMIGPGTGVAPFIGFLEERSVKIKNGTKLGPAHLFFGCRTSSTDYIYQDLLEGYTKNGVLSPDGLHVAFSRESGHLKLYVQDLVRAQAAEMWGLLERGANVYICGDARRMAPDVKNAFQEVAMKMASMSETEAERWMSSLVSGSRYLEDVWAG